MSQNYLEPLDLSDDAYPSSEQLPNDPNEGSHFLPATPRTPGSVNNNNVGFEALHSHQSGRPCCDHCCWPGFENVFSLSNGPISMPLDSDISYTTSSTTTNNSFHHQPQPQQFRGEFHNGSFTPALEEQGTLRGGQLDSEIMSYFSFSPSPVSSELQLQFQHSPYQEEIIQDAHVMPEMPLVPAGTALNAEVQDGGDENIIVQASLQPNGFSETLHYPQYPNNLGKFLAALGSLPSHDRNYFLDTTDMENSSSSDSYLLTPADETDTHKFETPLYSESSSTPELESNWSYTSGEFRSDSLTGDSLAGDSSISSMEFHPPCDTDTPGLLPSVETQNAILPPNLSGLGSPLSFPDKPGMFSNMADFHEGDGLKQVQGFSKLLEYGIDPRQLDMPDFNVVVPPVTKRGRPTMSRIPFHHAASLKKRSPPKVVNFVTEDTKVLSAPRKRGKSAPKASPKACQSQEKKGVAKTTKRKPRAKGKSSAVKTHVEVKGLKDCKDSKDPKESKEQQPTGPIEHLFVVTEWAQGEELFSSTPR